MQSGIMHGELMEAPEEPNREGFEFDGWYLDSAGTMPFDPEANVVTESITLYAGWKEK